MNRLEELGELMLKEQELEEGKKFRDEKKRIVGSLENNG